MRHALPRPALTAVAAVVVVAVALGGCSSGGGPERARGHGERPGAGPRGPDEERRRERAAAPRLVDTPCTDPAAEAAGFRCQSLAAPEDRADPTGRQVELPVLRLGSPSSGQAPVVVLHGGPGAGVVDDWALWSTADVVGDGDGELVLYDQRGAGRATPRLECPEHAEALLQVLATDAPYGHERDVVGAALRRCHERLRRAGVGLDHYDTPASTADLEDLRIALGADQLTLVGQSYGTRLALDYLRTHPDRVRALVLDGVDPPGAAPADPELAVQRLLDACERDDACAAAHPDLAGSLERTLARFDERPAHVVVDGGELSARELTVAGADLFAGLHAALYDTEVIAQLPAMVEAVAGDDGTLLGAVAGQVLPALRATAAGAFLSVECADAGGRATAPDGTSGRTSTVLLASALPYCDEWPVEPVDGGFATPVLVEDPPPTLVVAGELDPVTPAAGAADVAARLSATYVEVPRAGHSPMLAEPCTTSVLRSFLASPERPDLGCVEGMRPRPFA